MVTTAAKELNAPPTSHPKGKSMQPRVQELLQQIGPGKMSSVAYDTAWVARLDELDRELSNPALAWLSEHQLRDGSWGADQPFYYHDRLISTLAAMIALTYRGRRSQDRARIERGLLALEAITDSASQRLGSELARATAGFEMLVPTLVAEAERLGIIRRQGSRILDSLAQLRKAKLAKLVGRKINRHITTALSAELAGRDSISLLDIDNLQESNGSVGNSPSATAYFALYVRPADRNALGYLHDVVQEGGVPFVAPFEIFERNWILWNLMVTGNLDHETLRLAQPHLNYLENNWREGQGFGFSSSYSPTDGDDSAVGYELLRRSGREVDIDGVLYYEEEDHFRCFQLEADPSTDVNIHVLGALRAAGYGKEHPKVQKAIGFIRRTRIKDSYWLDKWNLSPFYTAAHAIIACSGVDDPLCAETVEWILSKQKPDGSWGFYGFSTAEETAYCIQALSIWRRYGGKIQNPRIGEARSWLEENSRPPFPPLWIGKSLYCPDLLVQCTILTALELAGE